MVKPVHIFCLVVLAFTTPTAEPSSIPEVSIAFFATEMPPGEYPPQYKAKADLVALIKPEIGARKIEELVIKGGEIIEFTKTFYRSRKPGVIVLNQATQVEATSYGKTNYLSRKDYYGSGEHVILKLDKGDVLHVLLPRAEGDIFFKFEGEIYGGYCSPCWDAPYEEELWINVERNSLSGWILVSDKHIELIYQM